MSADSWFGEILGAGPKPVNCSPASGNRAEGEQKVGTAESLTQQGFHDSVPTVPTVPTKKQSPRKSADNTPAPGNSFTAVGDIAAGILTAVATGQPTPAPALPADLMERVNLICRLEQWPAADRAEWLGILRRQIEQDGTPVRELVACLDAHLAKHHPNVGLPDGLHDCMSCDHWRGEATVPNGQQQLRTLVNPASTYRGNKVIGGCAQHYRPHRASNDPNQSAYLHWRFAGPCGWKPKQEENPS